MSVVHSILNGSDATVGNNEQISVDTREVAYAA